MGDAGGELASGLHLLRLRELDLEILLLGDIDEMEGEPLSRFTPRAGISSATIGANRPIPGVVEAAEEHDQRLIARPHRPNPERRGIPPPIPPRAKRAGPTLPAF